MNKRLVFYFAIFFTFVYSLMIARLFFAQPTEIKKVDIFMSTWFEI